MIGAFEHFDEFENALVGAIEAAGEAVGVRVVLAEHLEFANVHLADECRNILVVVVARFGLGDGRLLAPRGIEFDDAEAFEVAVPFFQPLERPGAGNAGENAPGNAVFFLQHAGHGLGFEQAERTLEDRADLGTGLEHIDRFLLHQRLQTLTQRGLAAADRAEQVEDLFALLQALGGVAKEADDAFDRLFHAVEFGKSRIDAYGAVKEDTAKAGIARGIDEFSLADGAQHSFSGARVAAWVVAAGNEIIRQAHLCLATLVAQSGMKGKYIICLRHHELHRELGPTKYVCSAPGRSTRLNAIGRHCAPVNQALPNGTCQHGSATALADARAKASSALATCMPANRRGNPAALSTRQRLSRPRCCRHICTKTLRTRKLPFGQQRGNQFYHEALECVVTPAIAGTHSR